MCITCRENEKTSTPVLMEYYHKLNWIELVSELEEIFFKPNTLPNELDWYQV